MVESQDFFILYLYYSLLLVWRHKSKKRPKIKIQPLAMYKTNDVCILQNIQIKSSVIS